MGRRGFSLVELVVVVVLILIITAAYLGLHHRIGGGTPQPTPVQAMQKAESVECRSNLNQVRQMIMMSSQADEPLPTRIDQGATAAISRCPVSGQLYSYNPQTGQVWCTTPGHERY